ncbi:SSrecog-domain-containing protein [Terfezia boudieri ATCC MYA-4762]|uniref:FACT complex subunit POB3 n=1 Tax=Terfezia boudieri ATCC MYA-4762 TaxID=1051890 RepID=A0A3N4LXW0_9PEZI|nr:SSrecog-domain-containing protein [Terfezia boudieri ATCC MYA-4762]
MTGEYETFENIYLDLSRVGGRCRFGASGMGWKPNPKGANAKDLKDQNMELWTLEAHEFIQAHWSRASKGYELKVFTRAMGIVQLDGFEQDDLDRVREVVKRFYNINVEHKEHALKGWNWGKAEFSKHELHFNVANKPAFEIPYSEVSNLNLAGKAEVAVEFASGDGKKKKNKATAGVDQLVEMRFFVPGTVKKGDGEDGDDASEDGEKGEEMQAANLFYDTLKEKAEIGEVAGVTYATFLDILFLTPRGRYDIDMYENSFRLRGKTYDYKIQYDHVKKFFLLPKPDDVHMMAVIGLEPPLRQGQTRYPFLVMQFKKEEDMEFDLNITEEVLKQKYDGRLQMHYESAAHQVVSSIFKGLTGKRITQPSRDFSSHHQQSGVKCSNKANEGHLFFLDKAFLFVPKPAVYMSFDNVQHVTLSRVGGSVSASRTFDMTVTLKDGQGEYQFNNINREEQQPLEAFLKTKNLRIKNEMVEEVW